LDIIDVSIVGSCLFGWYLIVVFGIYFFYFEITTSLVR